MFYLLLGLVLKVSLKVPVIVRLEGTNVDQGKRILKVNLKLNLMSNLWTEIHNVMRIIFDKLDKSVWLFMLIIDWSAGKRHGIDNGRRP